MDVCMLGYKAAKEVLRVSGLLCAISEKMQSIVFNEEREKMMNVD